KNILLENGLIHKKKVNLNSNEKLDRMLISSKGKLNSIAEIAKVECSALKDKLRMLVLTDYIKKDMLKVVGSEESLNVISIISVFEKLRRNLDKSAKLAILSGTLVVLPVSCLDVLADVSIIYNIKYTTKEINNTGYYEIKFKGSNKNKVSIITQIFEMGYINILIGTKSLLGEGWDSPCINSLILASFVGSFMLSNQMRGRAIRIDKNNPEKVSNIWHLTTIEPPMLFAKTLEDKTNAKLIDNTKIIHSNDYNTLTRRFECFLGPSYSKDVIESGINRLGEVVCPPYTESHFEEINQKMVELAVNRDALREKWERCVGNGENTAVREVVAVDKKAVKYPKSFYYFNYGLLILLFALECVVTINFFSYNSFEYNLKSVLYILFSVVILYVFLKVLVCILKFISPQKILKTLSKTVLKTLEDMGEIKSIKPRLVVNLVDEVGACIEVMLENVTTYEQNIFTTAVTEMFSAIDNPRYLIIKKSIIKNKLKYKYSFACPAIIGNKKENAQILEKYFSKNDGKYLVVYTRNEQGRE
ncbi:MAG: hypothetical protein IJZ26_03265, partial [Clostridia bacterium]|nr:hypothetical protein [Clostridia bacterium]